MMRIALLLSLVVFSATLTGCWDRKEVNDIALITALGIDKKGNRVEITTLEFIPKGGGQQGFGGGGGESGGGAQNLTLVRSAEGLTISDAISKLQKKIPRVMFWGLCEVFIMHEDIAKDGIAGHVDFLFRHPQLRERSEVFISKQKAKDVLSLIPPLERDPSEVLRELAELKIGMHVTTKDLAEMLIGESGAQAVPYIEILPPQAKGAASNQTIAYMTGTAIFKHGKMVGRIDEATTRGVLWLQNAINMAIVTIQPKDAKGYVSMNLLKAHSRLIPKIESGKWKITLILETDDDVVQNTTALDIQDPKITKQLEQDLRKSVINRVNSALSQVQKKMKADIFGFADAFHRAYPKEWKENKDVWDDIFPNVAVSIKVKAHLRRPGLINKPAGLPEQEVKK
ncbi:MAG TPA: Ger(x)C family spore germination protein [Bacilli bacterium]